MKFLCVPCDSPMKLQSVGPPERGSLSVVYSCPECGYEMAMLTNVYETQVVQSLGVRIGPEARSRSASGGKCPVLRDDSRGRRGSSRRAGPGAMDVCRRSADSRTSPSSSARWRAPASSDSPGRGGPWKWTKQSWTPPATSLACDVPTHDSRSCSPGPTSSRGTSPTAATSPASTAISTPAAPPLVSTENFSDRSELGTDECFRVIDEIAAFAPKN